MAQKLNEKKKVQEMLIESVSSSGLYSSEHCSLCSQLEAQANIDIITFALALSMREVIS